MSTVFSVMLVFSVSQADPGSLAQKAQLILKTNCYRCHGQDGTIEGGLNYMLDVKTLVARKKIIPGDPAKSRLMKRLESANNPMPPEEEKVRPSKEEIALLADWIRAGAPEVQAAAPARPFISENDILRLIHEDLQKLDERQKRFTRYFTICHLSNAGLSEDELQTYRHGLAKLVNSLSWEPDIVLPRAADPSRSIFRIDLRDYRWNSEVWQRLLEPYPYGILFRSATARAVSAATECDLPYLRADWFVFAASRPPLYHDILQLPKTDRELEQSLMVDVTANIKAERVVRAAFNGSGVSRNNRLIERHRTGYGAYWKSYDFASNTGKQNLFANPLGPGEGDRAFQQDGGEIIFNLPNGLQAYLLIDAKGNRIDEGPTKIVSVKNRPDPTVINGVSCMFCHARGMIDKTDQIRAHVDNNATAFSESEAERIRALYPPEAEFKALLQKDAERFRKAVAATGTKMGQMEPIVALAGRFEAEVDLPTAAAELGMAPAVFLRSLDRSPEFAQRLGALKVAGGTIQRQVFADAFAALVQSFQLGTSLFTINQAIAQATASIRRDPQFAPPYFQRGNCHFDKGDLDRAIADYSEAIRLGFVGGEIFRQRGIAFASKGNYDLAIPDYDAALRLEPQAETYHNRGLALAQKQEYVRALADLDESIRLAADEASTYSDRGFLHAKLGSMAAALNDYDKSIRLQPRSAATHVRRGDLLRSLGRADWAIEDYKQALELNPRFIQAYRNGAALFAQLGQLDNAIQWAKKALELAPEKDKKEIGRQLESYEMRVSPRKPE